MSTFNKVFFAFLIIAFSGSSNASMVTVNGGIGSTVSFSFDNLLVGLLGTATAVGDALKFNPSAFDTQTPLSGGVNFNQATLSVTITALAGHALSTVGLLEKGNYTLFGAGFVAATGQLTDSNSNQGFSNFAVQKQGTAGYNAGIWDASASLGYVPSVASTVVSFNNTLFAAAGAVQFADINKFDVRLTALTVPTLLVPTSLPAPTAVPLPMAVWMFGAGLFGMLSVSNRKKML